MTRKEYRYARKLIRANGARAAMHWMCGTALYEDMKRLLDAQKKKDLLAERADTKVWCIREGLKFNVKFDLLMAKRGVR